MSNEDTYTPLPSSAGPTRSRSTHSSRLLPATSPISTRSGHVLSPLKSSPYSRRKPLLPLTAKSEAEVAGGGGGGGLRKSLSSTALVGMVRGFPGRALGYLFSSSSSSKTLSTPPPVEDQEEEEEEEEESRIESTGAERGRGMPFTSTSSAYAAQLPPPPPRSARSAHATLSLPVRASSPALSTTSTTTSYTPRGTRPGGTGREGGYKSPSPTRTSLAGSISAFNLSSDPSSSRLVFPPAGGQERGGREEIYGLKSRSPFGRTTSRMGMGSSYSTTSLSSLNNGTPGGGGGLQRSRSGISLFPYTSTVPRGTTPERISSSSSSTTTTSMFRAGENGNGSSPSRVGGMRRSESTRGGFFAPSSTSSPQRFLPVSSARINPSPLVQSYVSQPSLPMQSEESSYERSRKKQLVWDPQEGFISIAGLRVEEEERERRKVPVNEAERVLQVLEGMGKTPLGGVFRKVRPLSSFSLGSSGIGKELMRLCGWAIE